MGFMQLQVEHFSAWEVETIEGEEIVPRDLVGPNPSAAELQPYCRGEVYTDGEAILVVGYWGRYSAPGYLDCTDWVGPYETAEEARAETLALYGDDGEEGGAQ